MTYAKFQSDDTMLSRERYLDWVWYAKAQRRIANASLSYSEKLEIVERLRERARAFRPDLHIPS